MALPLSKAQDEERTIVFVDEAGFYQLPFVARTYAPVGQTPVLRAPLSRDHLAVISGVTADGRLFTHIQDEPFHGEHIVTFQCDAPRLRVPGLFMNLVFVVKDFKMCEEGLKESSTSFTRRDGRIIDADPHQ